MSLIAETTHTALVFPGQGSQRADMRELVERQCPDLIELAIGQIGEVFGVASRRHDMPPPGGEQLRCGQSDSAAGTSDKRDRHAGESIRDRTARVRRGEMRTNPYYTLDDRETIERLIRENPWAILVSPAADGLVASHYPVLLDESRDELSVVTHLGRPDEKVHELGSHEMLMIIQGPHGYISSSWYGDLVEVPTWNFITVHLSGVPEIIEGEENFEILTRLVRHFEQEVERPRYLDSSPEVAEDARRDSKGTIGLRLTPTRIVAKQKMSQNKPPEVIEKVISELEGDGPFQSAALAREMRIANRLK